MVILYSVFGYDGSPSMPPKIYNLTDNIVTVEFNNTDVGETLLSGNSCEIPMTLSKIILR